MGDLDPEKSVEIDRLINDLAENKAQLSLVEWRREAEAVLDELRQIRDDFRELFRNAAKILSEEDRARWEKTITEAMNDGSS